MSRKVVRTLACWGRLSVAASDVFLETTLSDGEGEGCSPLKKRVLWARAIAAETLKSVIRTGALTMGPILIQALSHSRARSLEDTHLCSLPVFSLSLEFCSMLWGWLSSFQTGGGEILESLSYFFLKKKKKQNYFLIPLYVCICAQEFPQRPGRGTRPPGAGVTVAVSCPPWLLGSKSLSSGHKCC